MHCLIAMLLLAVDPTVSIELRRAADKASVTADKEKATLEIASASGIGAATLRPVEKKWPKSLTLVVNLKGLEGLTLTQGDIKLRTALGSDTHEGFRRLDKDRWEEAMLDKRYRPTIKKTAAFVTIEIPSAWLDAARGEIIVEWVDFYR